MGQERNKSLLIQFNGKILGDNFFFLLLYISGKRVASLTYLIGEM